VNCKCGCGQLVTKPENKFLKGHNKRAKDYNVDRYCECGCGELLTKGWMQGGPRRFIKGHWAKTKEGKELLKETSDKYYSENKEEFKQLMSDAMNQPEVKEKQKLASKSPKRLQHIINLAFDKEVKSKKSRTLKKLFEDEDFKSKHKKSVQGINKGKTPWNKGIPFKPHISEEKEIERVRKIRTAWLKKIQKRLENGHQIHPNYNPVACKVIDIYGEQYGYNFQHAENGGEFHIEHLGYWVDGYDEEKNVAIEVDEPFHFDSNGNLSERDVSRQKEIMEELGCEFIRLKLIEQ